MKGLWVLFVVLVVWAFFMMTGCAMGGGVLYSAQVRACPTPLLEAVDARSAECVASVQRLEQKIEEICPTTSKPKPQPSPSQ